MKNLLIMVAIITTTITNAQYESLVLNRSFGIYNLDYTQQNPLIVPEGKLWLLHQKMGNGQLRIKFPDVNAPYDSEYIANALLPENTELFGVNSASLVVNIIEYTLGEESGLGLFDSDFKNNLKLFPNPTNSELALNSDKQYEIKVFDLNGRKVMETTGNSLDMSILTNATYIVKAFDKESKETNTYKVVKN